jgi:hypothetical protein
MHTAADGVQQQAAQDTCRSQAPHPQLDSENHMIQPLVASPPPAILCCRCKVCETCTQSTGSSSRRCLLVRATAAAASGHAGAQLSVLGDKAVGAEIDVWWPLDQAWYKGLVSSSLV